jgi:hypothetical protein
MLLQHHAIRQIHVGAALQEHFARFFAHFESLLDPNVLFLQGYCG